ncbi:MAG: toxin-antitoxin system HicB family antitoxin [Egibacteraceae bacterium]
MDTESAIARFEAAVATQVAAAGDPTLEAAARSVLAALGPATRQLAQELAEQAATEIAAQLPEHDVDVVLRGGEPALAVREPRSGQAAASAPDEDYEARITLRLPPSLKHLVEESAGTAGDSVNAWVVKALSNVATRPRRGGRQVRGTVRT